MRSWPMVLLLVWSGANAQQVIWKCRDSKGAVTFQNSPCEPGTREVGARVFDTGVDSPVAAAQASRARAEMDRRNASLHAQSQTYFDNSPRPQSERDRQRARCEAARASVDRAIHEGWDTSVRAGLERAAIDACFGL